MKEVEGSWRRMWKPSQTLREGSGRGMQNSWFWFIHVFSGHCWRMLSSAVHRKRGLFGSVIFFINTLTSMFVTKGDKETMQQQVITERVTWEIFKMCKYVLDSCLSGC